MPPNTERGAGEGGREEWECNGGGELVQRTLYHVYGIITMKSPHIINI
jgi:hypothetical protein